MAVKDRKSYKKMVQILIVKIFFLSSIHHANDNDFFFRSFVFIISMPEKLKILYAEFQ